MLGALIANRNGNEDIVVRGEQIEELQADLRSLFPKDDPPFSFPCGTEEIRGIKDGPMTRWEYKIGA